MEVANYISNSEQFRSFNDQKCTRLRTRKQPLTCGNGPGSVSQALVLLGAGTDMYNQTLLNMSDFTEHQ